ncbi:MAG: hypothetical protein J6R74_03090 [Tidjanibacter sp.]|nr:hypothetical protein [Tidjanibacter sp.]
MKKMLLIIAIAVSAMACAPALNQVSVYDFSVYQAAKIHIFPESLQPQRPYFTLGVVDVVVTSGGVDDTTATTIVDVLSGTGSATPEMVEEQMISVAKKQGADGIACYTITPCDANGAPTLRPGVGYRASGVLIKYE